MVGVPRGTVANWLSPALYPVRLKRYRSINKERFTKYHREYGKRYYREHRKEILERMRKQRVAERQKNETKLALLRVKHAKEVASFRVKYNI